MENTLENKSKFFAQYWRQNVLGKNKYGYVGVCPNLFLDFQGDEYLELKPLSSITDDDAVEVIGLKEFVLRQNNKESGDFGCSASNIFVNTLYCKDESYLIGNRQLDYLRSKGYALPYNGLSVNQLLEYGWVKLKIE